MELKNPDLQCITVSATLPNDVIKVCYIHLCNLLYNDVTCTTDS